MDIWSWVYDAQRELFDAGEWRLAQLIHELPSVVCADEHRLAESMTAEALALLAPMDEPWLEVFVRHWRLQSRILRRQDVVLGRQEAAELLEFASHEPATKCPQAVCVTQDFINCFSAEDPIEHFDACVDAADETLARIDASWPCFKCVSTEKGALLNGAGRHDEALTYAKEQTRQSILAGETDAGRAVLAEVEEMALLQLGRADEALAVWKANPPEPQSGRSGELRYAMSGARIHAALGDVDEAKRWLPPVDDVGDTGEYMVPWAMAVDALVALDALDVDLALRSQLRNMMRTLQRNGAKHAAVVVGTVLVRLTLREALFGVASLVLAAVDEVRSTMASTPLRDAPLLPLRTALEAQLAQALDDDEDNPVEVPLTDDRVVRNLLRDEDDLEAMVLTHALAVHGESDEAQRRVERRLRCALQRNADDVDAAVIEQVQHLLFAWSVASQLPSQDRDDVVRQRLDTLQQDVRQQLHAWWSARERFAEDVVTALADVLAFHDEDAARDALRRHDLARVQTLASEMEQRGPLSAAMLDVLLHAALDDNHHADAHRHATSLVRVWQERVSLLDDDVGPEQRHHAEHQLQGALWDIALTATLIDDWDTVVDVIAQLGLPTLEERPVDAAAQAAGAQHGQPWDPIGLCWVQLRDDGADGGEAHRLLLERTGPAHGRVLSVGAVGQTQWHDAEVVFRPSPTNPPPAEGEEEQHLWEYAGVDVKRPSPFASTVVVDGVVLTGDAEAAFNALLDDTGAVFRLQSDDAYRIVDMHHEDSEGLNAAWGHLLLPIDVDEREVHQRLLGIRDLVDGRLHWHALAERVGDDVAREAMEQFIMRYGL